MYLYSIDNAFSKKKLNKDYDYSKIKNCKMLYSAIRVCQCIPSNLSFFRLYNCNFLNMNINCLKKFFHTNILKNNMMANRINKNSNLNFNSKRNKELNSTLLKQLVDVDFPYVKSIWKENKINSIDLRVNVKRFDYYNILNLYILNTNIKQFIRTLLCLKKNKTCEIYFWTTNEFILDLIEKFIEDYHFKNTIYTSKIFPTIKNSSNCKNQPVRYLFILGEPWTTKMKGVVKMRICNSDFLLVNHFTFWPKRDGYGIYEIQNDLSDYKKILVLLAIIDSVLNCVKKTKIKKNKKK